MSVGDILAPMAVVAALGLIVYAFLVEPYWIRLSEVDIRIEGLPESLDGFKICHLSDTHTSRYGRLERKLSKLLSGIEADLCVITGDLLNAKAGREALRRVLSLFNPRFGFFAVLGNGDYKPQILLPECVGELEQLGIQLLQNSSATLLPNGLEMSIIGVEDPFLGLDDIARAMSGAAEGGFKLLLAHSPDVVVEAAGQPLDLILAGHTHGGQVRIPAIGAFWLHCRYRLGISGGCYGPEVLSRALKRDVGRLQMYVNRGVASGTLSPRFMCPPEVALITLHRRFRA
ncbi:MAG TPA: metallophosphoesterase [Armatimonadota bacterium]|nr:metallophosphoesterase [Armatimonadota bacterium]